MKVRQVVKFKPRTERDGQLPKGKVKECDIPWHHKVPTLQRLYTYSR